MGCAFTTETLRLARDRASAAALVFAQMVYDLAAKSRFSRSVYDLIAKIWAETDPVYDLPAIDTECRSRK
jgi:hypothetical protein